jgi:hypothetical protein
MFAQWQVLADEGKELEGQWLQGRAHFPARISMLRRNAEIKSVLQTMLPSELHLRPANDSSGNG